MKLKKKEDQSVDDTLLLRRGNKIFMGENTKCGAETEGKAIQRLPHPGNPSRIQTPNPETIADAKKCLLAGACYSCLLRDSARA